jgi:hypothetical protein
MNQKKTIINLRDIVGKVTAFGNGLGREVYQKLQVVLDEHPSSKTIGISFEGMEMMDASFARESVVSLAKAKRGEIGFYLKDFGSKDLMDNWDYAAKAKEQPLMVIKSKGFEVIGPEITDGVLEVLGFIMKKESVTTSMVAEEFKLSVQNASGRLKKMLDQGLLLGSKEIAETGGYEYRFQAIK